jgi:hypothetical protein
MRLPEGYVLLCDSTEFQVRREWSRGTATSRRCFCATCSNVVGSKSRKRERKRKSREHRWRLIARGEMEPFVMDDVMAMWSDLSEGYVPRRSDRAERRGRAEAAEDEGLDRLLQAVSAQKVAA